MCLKNELEWIDKEEHTVGRCINLLRKLFYIHLKPGLNLEYTTNERCKYYE